MDVSVSEHCILFQEIPRFPRDLKETEMSFIMCWYPDRQTVFFFWGTQPLKNIFSKYSLLFYYQVGIALIFWSSLKASKDIEFSQYVPLSLNP